jgi:hypothetical protein
MFLGFLLGLQSPAEVLSLAGQPFSRCHAAFKQAVEESLKMQPPDWWDPILLQPSTTTEPISALVPHNRQWQSVKPRKSASESAKAAPTAPENNVMLRNSFSALGE